LEISNFQPFDNETLAYDFSFLENITEITGYILVFNSKLKYLPLKNLRIIRGWGLYRGRSIYIENNKYLNYLDFQNLKGKYYFHTLPLPLSL
jgi:hypothetical protein